jgi:hypothetical protein
MSSMSRTFDRANQLWLREGRTAAALVEYARAAAERPTDPVISFQYATALRAVDRFTEAAEMFRRARRHADELDDERRETLLALLPVEADTEQRTYPRFDPSMLDRDRLADLADDADWRSIADAADQRAMPGVAEYALDRWGGAPIDAEDAREVSRIRSRGARRAGALRELATPSHRPPDRGQPEPAGPGVEQLHLDVRVVPATTAVGAPATVECVLRNPGGGTVCVNWRLLVTHQGLPGEITVGMVGPAGYRNRTGFRVNAGAPGNESFVDLPPGGELRGDFELTDYHSIDVAGGYRLDVTYRNEIRRAPDGRWVLAGQLSGSATFRRTDAPHR